MGAAGAAEKWTRRLEGRSGLEISPTKYKEKVYAYIIHVCVYMGGYMCVFRSE